MNNILQPVAIGIVTVLGFVFLVAGIGLLLALPIKWAWNYTMPYLFDIPTITWGQAWCINFLAGCLIKTSTSKINQ